MHNYNIHKLHINGKKMEYGMDNTYFNLILLKCYFTNVVQQMFCMTAPSLTIVLLGNLVLVSDCDNESVSCRAAVSNLDYLRATGQDVLSQWGHVNTQPTSGAELISEYFATGVRVQPPPENVFWP